MSQKRPESCVIRQTRPHSLGAGELSLLQFYARDLGPSRWLYVVVDFSLPEARVVTAVWEPEGAAPLAAVTRMKIRIGQLTFDHASYDGAGDVLYLHVGEPQAAAESEETPEQHVVRFDQNGQSSGSRSSTRNGCWTVTEQSP